MEAAFAIIAPLLIAGLWEPQEDIKYTYDEVGRLQKAEVSKQSNNSLTTLDIDNANNRKKITVSNANGTYSGADNGTAPPQSSRLIVVPLNGFTIIPIG